MSSKWHGCGPRHGTPCPNVDSNPSLLNSRLMLYPLHHPSLFILAGAVTAAAKVTVRPTKIADRAQPPHHEVGHERMIEEGEEEMEEQEPTTSTTFAQPWVPWFGFEKAVTFMRQKGKNVIVQCNYCLPLFKTLSSAISSSSNVKQHFKVSFDQRKHKEPVRSMVSETRRSD